MTTHNLEGAEDRMEYTRGENIPKCKACGDTKVVHGPNMPAHPCPKCCCRPAYDSHVYTSSQTPKMMER
jgi:hypothetical protein